MAPSLLPLNGSLGSSSVGSSSSSASPLRFVVGGGGGSRYGFSTLRKLTKVGRMDFELAAWQLSYLVISPRRVYISLAHPWPHARVTLIAPMHLL